MATSTPPVAARIAGSIGPRIRATRARLTQYAGFTRDDTWALQMALSNDDGGFERVEITVDAGSLVLPASRAIIRHRIRPAIDLTIARLRDPALPWCAFSARTDGRIARGVIIERTESAASGLSVLLLNASRVPDWYKGIRRLAIAGFLQRLDLSSVEELPPIEL